MLGKITIFNSTTKKLKKKKKLKIQFLFTTYTDDSTFFLKDISSVKMLVETFKKFSCFSGLKSSIAKCGTAGLGPLKGVLEAVCGLKTADLTNDTIKILGLNFLYHN